MRAILGAGVNFEGLGIFDRSHESLRCYCDVDIICLGGFV